MKCELLAPAGNGDALKSAIEAGADAVYLAGTRFGARAFAGNFDDEALKDAVRFAHLRGVAVHVTVNTLIFDREIEPLVDYLQFLDSIAVDAVLLQDLGAAKLAKKVAPRLALHTSTQMTVHNLAGGLALADVGFSRVVLARELSLGEIEHIVAHSPIEIEIFMHGALCVCYSGQCLMSSQIFGRSANRGRCAQPCRLPYTLVDGSGRDVLGGKAGKYLLSPRDLNTLDILPQLVKSGVASLKIEGRMKRAEYVATVTNVYRRALDRVFSADDYRVDKTDTDALTLAFNRDFTHAWLMEGTSAVKRREMMSDLRPNNRGLLIGRTERYDSAAKRATVKLVGALGVGDEVDFWVKIGGRVTAKITALTDAKGQAIETAMGGVTVSFAVPRAVRAGDRVFKVYDAKLTEKARQSYGETPLRRIGVTAHVTAKLGEPLRLTLTDTDGNNVTVATDFVAETAQKHALTVEMAKLQIERLGTTVFELKDFSADIADGIMVPVSEINNARRHAVEDLEKLRLKVYKNNMAKKAAQFIGTPEGNSAKRAKNGEALFGSTAKQPIADSVCLTVSVYNSHLASTAIKAGADAVLFGGDMPKKMPFDFADFEKAVQIARESGKKIYLALPRIVPTRYLPFVREMLRQSAHADAVYVHDIGMLKLARESTDVPIHTDWSLVCGNAQTVAMLKDCGAASVTLSPELTLAQIKEIVGNSPLPLECIVDGRQELMISKFCVAGNFLAPNERPTKRTDGQMNGECGASCLKRELFLKDRKGVMFPVWTDRFCNMHILNSKPLSMLGQILSSQRAETAGGLPLGAMLRHLRLVPRCMEEQAAAKDIKLRVRLYKKALNGTLDEEELNDYERDMTRGGLFRGVE